MTDFNLTADQQFASHAEAAIFYSRLGWDPLVLPERKKAPKDKWGDLPSFGRETSPHSHRFARSKLGKNRQLKIPPDAANLFPAERAVVMELRGDGLQTMVPPSMHPKGEIVRWYDDPHGVPEVGGDDLVRRAGATATLAVVLAKYSAGPGNRDNICLALTGVLVRTGFSDDETDRWVEHVAGLAGDDEAAKRGGKAAATRTRLEAGEQVWGVPALCEHLGIEPMGSTLRRWLGLHGDEGRGGANAIAVRPGFMPQAVDAAEATLMAASIPVYQRYDTLVRAIHLSEGEAKEGQSQNEIERVGGALILQPVVAAWLHGCASSSLVRQHGFDPTTKGRDELIRYRKPQRSISRVSATGRCHSCRE